jgi:hypothetical protein
VAVDSNVFAAHFTSLRPAAATRLGLEELLALKLATAGAMDILASGGHWQGTTTGEVLLVLKWAAGEAPWVAADGCRQDMLGPR